MFNYDTVHGRFKGTVTHDAENVIVNGKPIRVFNNMNVSEQHARAVSGQHSRAVSEQHGRAVSGQHGRD